jgi:radical SAM protein with 4Fe4S-binding SPASM domain
MTLKRFKKIYIEITNACNLRCSFCSVTSWQTGFMPVDLFARILEKIHPYTNHIYLHVKGEPLLHPHLSTLLDLCYSKGLKVAIVTNGTLLAEKGEMLWSKPALRQVNVSLHCFSELPSYIDKTAYLNGVFNFTKQARTHSSIIVSLRFWNAEKGGLDVHPDNRVILYEIQKEFAPDLLLEKELKPGKGLKLADRLYLNSDFEFSWPSLNDPYDNPKGFCYGLRDQIAILHNGTIVPCCLDAEGIINLGNIQDIDMPQLLNSEQVKKIYDGFSNSIRVEPLCRKCRFIQKFASAKKE